MKRWKANPDIKAIIFTIVSMLVMSIIIIIEEETIGSIITEICFFLTLGLMLIFNVFIDWEYLDE